MSSRLRRHDEAGHVHFLTISCFQRLQFFAHVSVRDSFVDTMRLIGERLPIRWIGYVVMPEHVHLMVLPQQTADSIPVPISTVLHDLKGLSGKACKEALRAIWRERRSLGAKPLNLWATTPGPKPFWKPRGYDFNVIQEQTLMEKLNYIHNNPIRRGIVRRAEDWPWSSFRYFEGLGHVKIKMDWDGSFPLL